MKICFFGIYDPSYSRNNIILTGLKKAGVDVVECRADWRDTWRYVKLWRSLRALKNQYDCVYAAYPSPVATIVARLVSRKLVISDAFYSMYDAVVIDRKEIPFWHPRAVKLLLLDWLGVMLAHAVTVDTEEHKKYWSSWFGVNKNKIHALYLGFNDEIFYPMPAVRKDYFLVHFHGYYIPVQGVDKIIEVARLCADNPKIRFRLVGSGQDSEKVRKLVEQYKLINIEFVGRVSLAELNAYMSEADAVLGIFGDTPKAKRAIPNKVYEGLAVKRSVITMDTPAVREIFSDSEIVLVKNDPNSMAQAISELSNNEKLCEQLSRSGYEKVCRYKPMMVAKSLINIISKYIS